MKEQENKNIDALVDKMMNGVDLETPSLDFTENIMSQVEVFSASKITTQKPLISKLGWGLIAIAIITIITYAIIGETTNEASNSWFNTIDYSVLYNNSITQFLSGIVISKTVLYSIILFGAMLFIQIPLLKYYFNKRLEV
jgi:hypothetical protein